MCSSLQRLRPAESRWLRCRRSRWPEHWCRQQSLLPLWILRKFQCFVASRFHKLPFGQRMLQTDQHTPAISAHRSTMFGLLKRIATDWSSDNATSWSASLAFYTLLSLAPLLFLTVTMAGLIYGKRGAQGQLAVGLRNLVGPEMGPAIQVLLASPHKPVTSFVATAFGAVALFFGASAVLTELRTALNAIWHVPVNPT